MVRLLGNTIRQTSGMQMPLHRIRAGVKIPAAFDRAFLPIKMLVVIAFVANFSATVTHAAGTNYSALFDGQTRQTASHV